MPFLVFVIPVAIDLQKNTTKYLLFPVIFPIFVPKIAT